MMNRVYRLREDDIPGIDGEVSAIHRWGMPGLNCSICGQTWSRSGLELPSVDLTSIGNEFRDKDARRVKEPNVWPVDNRTLERLTEFVRPLVPKIVELFPGTDFGPLIGHATGPFVEFTTLLGSGCTFLAKAHVIAELEAAGFNIKAVKAELEFDGETFEDLFEFEILPLVHAVLAKEVLAGRCARCGRIGATVPERIAIYGDSWPKGQDLARAIELPTVVLCTERFRETVCENGWLGIRFEEVEVVSRRF